MNAEIARPRSRSATIAFNVFDPIPYGFFVGALIFDAVYADSAEVLWCRAAAWLIAIGLIFAVLPRLIDLTWTWFAGGQRRVAGDIAAFWLNALAIVAAIFNAFVHSRDAYGVMPQGLWLSCLTIALLILAKAVPVLQRVRPGVST